MPENENTRNENTGDENTGELHESPLSPADDERIRLLLAEARHTERMPDAVAARLDRVLAGLSTDRAEREAADAPRAPVVELAARRRRTAANLLVAAAAVIAVGFGLTQVLPGLGGSSADESPSATTAQEDGAAADSAGGDSRNTGPEAAPEASTEEDGAAKSTFRLRSDDFGHDVRRVRNQVDSVEAPALLEYPASGCLTAAVDPGSKVVAATYDAAPAALVLRPPSGDVQVVDLYLCGDAAPRRSITLTTP